MSSAPTPVSSGPSRRGDRAGGTPGAAAGSLHAFLADLHERNPNAAGRFVDELMKDVGLEPFMAEWGDRWRIRQTLVSFFSPLFGAARPAGGKMNLVAANTAAQRAGLRPDWHTLAFRRYLNTLSMWALRPSSRDGAAVLRELQEFVIDCLHDLHRTRLEELRHEMSDGQIAAAMLQENLAERAAPLFDEARASGRAMAAIAVEVQNFGEIASLAGLEETEDLMAEVHRALREALREQDIVQRFRANGFRVLLAPLRDPVLLTLAVEKLRGCFNEPYRLHDRELPVRPLVGTARFPDHGEGAAELFECAEFALHAAHKRGVAHLEFDAALAQAQRYEHELEAGLRSAPGRDELRLHFQPLLDLRSGAIAGAEALLRWRHPVHGQVGPDVFIPIAERSGAIDDITRWVLNAALGRSSGDCAPLSVNLSAVSLRDHLILDVVQQALRTWDFAPDRLVLEITESAMMENPRRAMETLAALHELGVRIAVDDFGTGHSSLAYLKDLPADILKIDRSFVTGMLLSPSHERIVATMVNLAHGLGMSVVAEGVEDRRTLERLRDLGCDKAQGYHLAKPMPGPALDTFVSNHRPENWTREGAGRGGPDAAP